MLKIYHSDFCLPKFVGPKWWWNETVIFFIDDFYHLNCITFHFDVQIFLVFISLIPTPTAIHSSTRIVTSPIGLVQVIFIIHLSSLIILPHVALLHHYIVDISTLILYLPAWRVLHSFSVDNWWDFLQRIIPVFLVISIVKFELLYSTRDFQNIWKRNQHQNRTWLSIFKDDLVRTIPYIPIDNHDHFDCHT